MEDLFSSDLVRSFAGPRRLISLDYYDGTTSGLIRLDEAATDYRYDLVAWDSNQDIRVFCLSSLAPFAFDKAVEVISILGKPSWPCWYPLWKFTSQQEREATERRLNAIVGDQSGPYAVAVLCADLCGEITRAMTLSGESYQMAEEFRHTRAKQPFEKWLIYFGERTADP
jgi:hypothetical protein